MLAPNRLVAFVIALFVVSWVIADLALLRDDVFRSAIAANCNYSGFQDTTNCFNNSEHQDKYCMPVGCDVTCSTNSFTSWDNNAYNEPTMPGDFQKAAVVPNVDCWEDGSCFTAIAYETACDYELGCIDYDPSHDCTECMAGAKTQHTVESPVLEVCSEE